MNELVFMEKLLEKLREEERIIKLSSVQLKKKKDLSLTFIIESSNYDKYLSQKLKKKVFAISRELVPDIFDLEIQYRKTITEEKYILNETMSFIYNEFPTVFSFLQNSKIDVKITGSLIELDIFAEKYIYNFCKKAEIENKLAKRLQECFMEDVIVNVIEIPNQTEIEIDNQPAFENVSTIKLIDISITEHLLGVVGKKPRYISEVKHNEIDAITLCGIVSGLREIEYKSKEGKFYVFNINDSTSAMQVKFFPSHKKAKKIGETLKDGDMLAIQGGLKLDKFTNSLALFANRIAKCVINYESINTSPIYKKEFKTYKKIFPKKYISEEQTNIFKNPNDDYNEVFKDKVFVVFDLETTGIGTADKITEIGAVKIIDGQIKEIFETLINPEMKLSQNIVELTGITDSMLEDAPLFEDVVADFYKFTRGAILVAHNAKFDMGFIKRQGRECFYNFDNAVVDTIVLAKQNLSLNNYKLKTVCKYFDVENDSAHRALSDALATAKVFKKLIVLKENKRKLLAK